MVGRCEWYVGVHGKGPRNGDKIAIQVGDWCDLEAPGPGQLSGEEDGIPGSFSPPLSWVHVTTFTWQIQIVDLPLIFTPACKDPFHASMVPVVREDDPFWAKQIISTHTGDLVTSFTMFLYWSAVNLASTSATSLTPCT